MSTETKSTPRTLTPLSQAKLPAGIWQTPPSTMEERLQGIETLGERINRSVQFMRGVASLTGTSAEAKAKAVSDFYDRMVVLEKQLGRIREELQLG